MFRKWWSDKRLPNVEYVVAVLLIVGSFLLVQGIYLAEDQARREAEVEQALRYRAGASAELVESAFRKLDNEFTRWLASGQVRTLLLAQLKTPMTETELRAAPAMEGLAAAWSEARGPERLPLEASFSLLAMNRVVIASDAAERVGETDGRLNANDWARAQGGLPAWTVLSAPGSSGALLVARAVEDANHEVAAIATAWAPIPANDLRAGPAPVAETIELLAGVSEAAQDSAEVQVVWPDGHGGETIDAIAPVTGTTLAVRLRWDAVEARGSGRRLRGLVILLDVLLLLGALFVLAVARPARRHPGETMAAPVRSASAWVVLGVCACAGVGLWLVASAVVDSYELRRFHASADRLAGEFDARLLAAAATQPGALPPGSGMELLVRQAPPGGAPPRDREPAFTVRDDAGGNYEAFVVQPPGATQVALRAEPGILSKLMAARSAADPVVISVKGRAAGSLPGMIWLRPAEGPPTPGAGLACPDCKYWSGVYAPFKDLFARPAWLTDDAVAYSVEPIGARADDTARYHSGDDADAQYERVARLAATGGDWRLRITAGEGFVSADSRSFPLLLSAGVLAVGAFLFGFTHARSRTSTVVLRRASSMIRRSEALERKARAVLNQLPDGIVEFDEDGAIEGFNLGAEHLFDYPEEEMIGKHVSLLLPDLEFPRPVPAEGEAMVEADGEEESAGSSWETVGRRRDGTEIPLLLSLGDIDVDDRKVYTACVSDTFSLANVAGPDSKELAHFEQALAIADACLWEWDLRANRLFLSPQWGQLTGVDFVVTENGPEVWFDGMHPDDFSRVLAQLSEHIDGRTDSFHCEYRIRRSDGSYQWVSSKGVAVRDEQGAATLLAGSHVDINERKRAEAAPAKPVPVPAANEVIPSRPRLLDHLHRLADKVDPADGSFVAVILVDLNYFKAINDSLGSHAGDQVLAVVAERLQRAVPDGDFTLRLGADEFAVVLRALSEVSEASRIAETMRRELGYPITIGDEVVLVSATMGISRSSARHIEPETLLHDAETALRQAKSRGRMQQEFSGIPGAPRFSSELLGVETALRRALSEQEFLVSYQPILSLSSGNVAGCEALIRWQHPERGLLLPVEFIQLAEDTGLLTPLTEWLLETVLDQAAEWRRTTSPNLFVSVNLAAQQLQEKELLEAVPRILTRTGADPELLRFEIPASPMLESAEEILTSMMELSAEGTHFMLDNFGTGCSSLTYLRRFPIRGLKMEKRFLRGISANAGSSEYLSRIITLAHELNFLVSINGVEMPGQLAYLRLEGFDEVQGYHVSPPVDAQAFTRLLRDGLKMRTPLRVEPAAAGKR